MEVHHHAHTSRKKWTHYFWEFLMLFLAVFCGFMAENQREHYIEHQREKVLMKSMIKDVRADTANFSSSYLGISRTIRSIDSLILLLSSGSDIEKNALEIYSKETPVNLYYKVIYTDRTIQQLKNSGNFRLIRNAAVSDAIIQYDAFVDNYVLGMQDSYVQKSWERLMDLRSEIFKSEVFRKWMKTGYRNNIIELPRPPYFLTNERTKLDNYMNQLQNYAVANEWFLLNLGSAIRMGERVDSLIRAEYRLK